VRPTSARSSRRRIPSALIRSRRSLPIPGFYTTGRQELEARASAITMESQLDSNFLYGFKAPGCAPLRRARFPALAAPALLPSAPLGAAAADARPQWIGPRA
ncbi:hypothetical protein NGM37_60640, partial [Streptomyces sp. TRM76130]|nr:hypothetical protein [Streptomyces sp. TRM76130]